MSENIERPKRHTRWETLHPTFKAIEHDCLLVVNSPQRWRLWSYERLARLAGRAEDWEAGGYLRAMIYGGANRLRLAREFRLFHQADMNDHSGIRFTCDPDLAMEWARSEKTSIVLGSMIYIEELTRVCAELRPTRKHYFAKLRSRATAIIAQGQKLNSLGDNALFRIAAGDDAA